MANLLVWSETTGDKLWRDCTFSAYAMAMQFGGFTNFPLGNNTAAERNAFAGNYSNGATLSQADAQAKARYGVALKPISGSLSTALTKPNTALVVTGNYNRLSPASVLGGNVLHWNNYKVDAKGNLPDVNHAVTVLVNPDGSLTWLDPTAPNNSNGIPVSVAEVLTFSGGNSSGARVVAKNELGYGGDLGAIPGKLINPDDVKAAFTPLINRNATWGEALKDPKAGKYIDQAWLDKNNLKASDPVTLTQVVGIYTGTNLAQGWFTDPALKAAGDATGLGAIADILGKFTNPSNWLHLGAMLLGVGMVGFGVWTMTKDLNETGPQGLVSPMPIILKKGA
jgi:hypothetical protein